MPRVPSSREIRTTTDAGRVRLLERALRELERADKAEVKAAKAFDRKESRTTGRALSKAAKRVDDWANVVETITRRFERDVFAIERRRQRRSSETVVDLVPSEIDVFEGEIFRFDRPKEIPRGGTWSSDNPDVVEIDKFGRAAAVGPGIATISLRVVGFLAVAIVRVHSISEEPLEWEFSCEYLAGDSSSNVDVNFRIRRNDGQPFGAAEAKRAMQTFRAQVSAGLMTAPPGYRIAGIDWRRPSKRQTGWTKHGQFPRDLEGLSNVLYVASDHPSLWRLGGVDD